MSKVELAGFLRDRRARLQPARSDGRLRRTPGLRREEVAHRASMSVEYYTGLEQARGQRRHRASAIGDADLPVGGERRS